MNRHRLLLPALAAVMLVACQRPPAGSDMPAKPANTATAAAPAASAAAPAPTTMKPATAFTPPPESAIPEGPFGDMVREGRELFVHTAQNAPAYVGNGLA